MKRILKISLALVFIAIVLLLNYNISYADSEYGIISTITSSIQNGGEVKAGEEITYTIKLKNSSDYNFILPALSTSLPEGTTFVKAITQNAYSNNNVFEEDGILVFFSDTLYPNEERTFYITVKVNDDYKGEINYAFDDLENKQEYGLLMYCMHCPKNKVDGSVIEDFFENKVNVKIPFFSNQPMGDFAVVEVIDNKQTHKVISMEEQENKIKEEEAEAKKKATEEAKKKAAEEEAKKKAEEEAVAKKKAEEEATAKKKAEEEAKKAEQEKPVVKETKPTQLPKTGNEVDIVVVLFGTIMIMAGTVLLIKQK